MRNRKLANFPPDGRQQSFTLGECLTELLKEDTEGYLIHAGPGSGKTSAVLWLAEQIDSEPDCLVLGRFDLSVYRAQMHSDLVFSELARRILDVTKNLPGGSIPSWRVEKAESAEELLLLVRDVLQSLAKHDHRRQVLFLDNFESIHPWAAVGVASRLRTLFNEEKAHFTLVLTAAGDLDQVIGKDQSTSPLWNVVLRCALLDLDRQEAEKLTVESSFRNGLKLSEIQIEKIWEWTRGYPALIMAVTQRLAEKGSQDPASLVDGAVHQALRDYSLVEPFCSSLRDLEERADLGAQGYDPAGVLESLVAGNAPESKDRGARLLQALGILGMTGRRLSWRNPMVQEFWEKTGERFARTWRQRPSALKSGTLSAEGSIVVSLILDLQPLLEGDAKQFDRRRGTDKWIERLRKATRMIPEGPFTVWEEQARLAGLGLSLDLFRQEVVRRSLMPVYQARTKEVDLRLDRFLARRGIARDETDRLENARKSLERAWQRWQWVRIQLTRDGALHVVLVRELYYPVPLIQILNELLGLEEKLYGGDQPELSVQWELALAVADAFFRQLADEESRIPALDLTWKGASSIKPESSSYPLRDRYVVYQLRKACDCRRGGQLQPDGKRQIITIPRKTDLETNTAGPQGKELEEKREERFRHASELVSLLEGVMIRDSTPGSRTGLFPELEREEVRKSLDSDLSSWRNELFVNNLDSSLIMYQTMSKSEQKPTDPVCRVCGDAERQTILDLHFSQKPAPYEDYWKCLVMGLQYVIELRWGAQWIANRTSKDLQRLASLMGKRVTERKSKKVRKLTQNLALYTRLLSHLRDASVPLSIASASYAARKYEALIAKCGLRETVSNAEKDIEGINSFLHHHEDQNAQDRSGKVGKVAGIAGIILAVLAILTTLPSMWADFAPQSSIGDALQLPKQPPYTILTILTIFALAGVWEVAHTLYMLSPNQARRTETTRFSIGLPTAIGLTILFLASRFLDPLPVPALIACVGAFGGVLRNRKRSLQRVASGFGIGLVAGLCFHAVQLFAESGTTSPAKLVAKLCVSTLQSLVVAGVVIATSLVFDRWVCKRRWRWQPDSAEPASPKKADS
jgi:AAA domain